MCRGRWHGWRGEDERTERTLTDRGFASLILDLLKERKASGFDLVQTLEDKLKGLFTVSPADIYPLLRLLEDQGFAVSEKEGDRTVYRITEDGQKYLDERAEDLAGFWERVSAGRYRLEIRELAWEIKSLSWTLHEQATENVLPPERLQRLRELIEQARKEFDELAS
jgi:DNA-binding PadR family transcriptional regulator